MNGKRHNLNFLNIKEMEVFISVGQGYPNSGLEGRCPACLRCFPDTTHLILMNGLDCHPGLHES